MHVTLIKDVQCQQKAVGVGLYLQYELVAFLCSALSSLYLFVVMWYWVAWGEGTFSNLLYHVSWSYLRPSYAILFALYWFKSLPGWQFMQTVVCGGAFFFFAFLCPLTETTKSAKFGYCGFTPADGFTRDAVGFSSHKCEAFCFYLSWFLYAMHSCLTGVLERSYPKQSLCGMARRLLCRCITLWLLVACYSAFCFNLFGGNILDFDQSLKKHGARVLASEFKLHGSHWSMGPQWVWCHYVCGYAAIMCGTLCTIARGAGSGVWFSVAEHCPRSALESVPESHRPENFLSRPSGCLLHMCTHTLRNRFVSACHVVLLVATLFLAVHTALDATKCAQPGIHQVRTTGHSRCDTPEGLRVDYALAAAVAATLSGSLAAGLTSRGDANAPSGTTPIPHTGISLSTEKTAQESKSKLEPPRTEAASAI
jgi:hypothetical protein